MTEPPRPCTPYDELTPPLKQPSRVSFRTEDQPEVEVLWEGVWCFGLLAEWKQVDGRWVGTVRFNHGVGKNRIEAFDQDLIHPV